MSSASPTLLLGPADPGSPPLPPSERPRVAATELTLQVSLNVTTPTTATTSRSLMPAGGRKRNSTRAWVAYARVGAEPGRALRPHEMRSPLADRIVDHPAPGGFRRLRLDGLEREGFQPLAEFLDVEAPRLAMAIPRHISTGVYGAGDRRKNRRAERSATWKPAWLSLCPNTGMSTSPVLRGCFAKRRVNIECVSGWLWWYVWLSTTTIPRSSLSWELKAEQRNYSELE